MFGFSISAPPPVQLQVSSRPALHWAWTLAYLCVGEVSGPDALALLVVHTLASVGVAVAVLVSA